jgi:hypothetical protein
VDTPRTDASAMEFRLQYHGPAVDAGRMSAREAGPAIFGIGLALERASELLYGPDRKLNVDVHADFEHGSFVIDFNIVQQAVDLLGSEAAKTVLTVLFGTTGASLGVFGIYRRLRRGESLEDVEAAPPTDPPPVAGTAITSGDQSGGGDNYTFNIHADNVTLSVAKDQVVQGALSDVLAPVQNNPGIEAVSFQADDRVLQRIPREEVRLLAPPMEPIENVVTTDILPAVTIGIAVVPFFGKSKWRFVYNNTVFPAPILDEDWLRAASAIRWGRGDMLKVEAEVQTIRKGTTVENKWKILKVLEYFPSVTQIDLLANPEEPDDDDWE